MLISYTLHPLFDRDAERLAIADVAWQISEDSTFIEVLHLIDVRVENVVYEVTSVPKPFGGVQWYFICPTTGKRARVLYRFYGQNGGLFGHRSAFPNACHASQTEAKSDRVFTSMRKADHKLQRAAIKRNAKIKYRGRLTRHLDSAKRRYELLSQRVNVNNSPVLNRESRVLACLRRRFDRLL